LKAVTGAQMRKIERMAIEETGIPSILMMENAAIRLTEHCLNYFKEIKNAKALIFAGHGNNGGDGFALARHLHFKGIDIKIIIAGDIDSIKGDAAVNLKIVQNMKIPIEHDINSDIEKFDLIVDALLGTGLDRNVEGKYKDFIEKMNRYAKYIISVDVPSGVHSDTGKIMGCAVKATETVTFAHPKPGLYIYPGAACTGRIHIEDISIPSTLIDKIDVEANILTAGEVKKMLPLRAQRSNKGTFGRIIVFAGSNEMPGAASLTCSAAYKAGGGLVCACVLPHVASVIHHWQREIVTCTVPEKSGMYCKKSLESAMEEIERANVIVIGPGIGRSPDITEFVHELVKTSQAAIVADADALFALSEDVNIFKQLKTPCIITPHPGEMSRLTGFSVPEILDNTAETAVNFAKEFNTVTLLKDAHTIIANSDGKYYINTTGTNALSKAGTGDVLTGIIAGFIAQGLDVFSAGVLGAYFHGKAGEDAVGNGSCYSVMAGDLLDWNNETRREQK